MVVNMKTSPMEKILLTFPEACDLCSVSGNTMEKWSKDDDFPMFREGSKRLIYRKGLEAWTANRAKLRIGV